MRALALGMAVGALTLVGHGLGRGHLSVVAAVVVLGLALAVAAALTAFRLRLHSLVLFVVGFEVAGHWLLARLGHPTTGHGGGALHQGHVGAAIGGGAATPQLPAVVLDPSAGALQLPDLRMLAGHAAAATVIVALAWSADAALHGLEAALGRLLAVVFGAAYFVRVALIVPARAGGVAAARAVPALTPAAALPARSHRGPPAACAILG